MISMWVGGVGSKRLAALGLSAAIAAAGLPAHAQTAAPGELRLGPIGIMTQAPTLLDFSAGVYDLIGNAHRNETGAAGAELRLGRRWAGIGPAIGTIVDLHGGGMIYAGIDTDLAVGPIVVTPLLGLGAWWRGSGRDENLGGTFQFRMSLTAAYVFQNGSRLGLRFGHISNADIHRVNPGENDLMITYAIPLGL
jgi:lipid A 3-O-deacylase